MTATSASSRIPVVGEPAPDFALQSTAGTTVRLSELRGKSPVLLAFFPLAFTSTCTAELCEFSENFDQFAGKGVAVLPISVDSVPTLKEFKAKHAMKTDLLSDFKREASRAFGVLREDTFFSERAYFLLDRDGVVRWSHVESKLGDKRDTRELLGAISSLA
ncbi:MAG TPA: redoxin domain-containing protein [Gemmatimonadaceae bacterium]